LLLRLHVAGDDDGDHELEDDVEEVEEQVVL
jgi:hypothetical protein